MEGKRFKKFLDNVRDTLSFKTVSSKIILTCVIFALVVLFFMNYSVSSTIENLEKQLITSRLESDINYIQDIISHYDKEAYWHRDGKKIYYGNLLIGDGTEENANLVPFLEHQKKTHTFSYVFVLDRDAELGYVESTETSKGYFEGRYLRVAGSTKSPEGKSIVGTYISKEVADELDKNGFYSGEANVAGGDIYCIYKVLKNKYGDVVGAMVVGRNISELKAQILSSVNNITFFMIIVVMLCCIIIIMVIYRSISSIGCITSYLKEIESGDIPENDLDLNTQDEFLLISEGVNKMVASLKENAVLRKKSETDALTNLPNRFAYEYYSKSIFSKLNLNPDYLAFEIIDIDYFKQYNDNYGHKAGDECITAVASVFKEVCDKNKNIFCCRYGGDEFVMIYTHIDRSEIEEIVRFIKDGVISLNIRHDYSETTDIITVTQGVCCSFFDSNHRIVDYFNRADEALYKAKKQCRNNYRIEEI